MKINLTASGKIELRYFVILWLLLNAPFSSLILVSKFHLLCYMDWTNEGKSVQTKRVRIYKLNESFYSGLILLRHNGRRRIGTERVTAPLWEDWDSTFHLWVDCACFLCVHRKSLVQITLISQLFTVCHKVVIRGYKSTYLFTWGDCILPFGAKNCCHRCRTSDGYREVQVSKKF
jgi:hypothetical protein